MTINRDMTASDARIANNMRVDSPSVENHAKVPLMVTGWNAGNAQRDGDRFMKRNVYNIASIA